MRSRRRSRRFDKAHLISLVSDRDPGEWSYLSGFMSIMDMDQDQLLKLLRELVAEGWLEEEKYQRECCECGAPLDISYKYRLRKD